MACRSWRLYLPEAAGKVAFPAEAPGDHKRFRLRGRRTAGTHRHDTGHFCLTPPLPGVQQSLLSMRRDERRETHARLAAGRQG